MQRIILSNVESVRMGTQTCRHKYIPTSYFVMCRFLTFGSIS